MRHRSEKRVNKRTSSRTVDQNVNAVVSLRAASAALTVKRSDPLPEHLMERICDRQNLNTAFKLVKSNRGSPGIDGMTIEQAHSWISANKDSLIKSLLDGSYEPQSVRGVKIPKPGGGARELGIPTVIDRVVQQAILQIIQPLFDPHFSPSSFGFRPGRSAHQAVQQAHGFVKLGYVYVVDIDLEKFFDRVNHDMLMARVARQIGDKRLLRILRRFLEAGMMSDGVLVTRHEGTPQGGPLSPLLSNILLDDLDRELERRGHQFCRYADDCNVYVKSRTAAERVLTSITTWIERKLKLKVNREKSAAAYCGKRKFLGYTIQAHLLSVASSSWDRLRQKLLRLTRRHTPISMADRVKALNQLSRGWINYFKYASCKTKLANLDEWLRRRLRAVKLRELKRVYPRVCFARSRGVSEQEAWRTFLSGKRLWRLSATKASHLAMNHSWFNEIGWQAFSQLYKQVKC